MDEAEGQLARMSDEWNAVLIGPGDDRAVLADWEQSMDSMRRETACLRDQGLWRGGHRTLMHALGRSNWYFPRWLDRITPRMSVEPPEVLAEEAGGGMVRHT